jgi:putative oxidoreductase
MPTITNYDSKFATSAYSQNQAQLNRTTSKKIETKSSDRAAWAIQIFLGCSFLFFGALKLGGDAKMVALFSNIGVGQWLRYVTGTIEVVSAVLLFTPKSAAVGAGLLAFTMGGAIAVHLLLIGGSPVLPIIFLGLSVALVALRWNRVRLSLGQENVVNV